MFRLGNYGVHSLFQAIKRPSAALRVAQSQRSIVNIASLKDTYQAVSVAHKHQSPLHGAIFSQTKGINRLYDLAQMEKKPTATSQLVKSLFHCNESEFRATQNQTLPAYSISPTLLADIMYQLQANTLSDGAVRDQLYETWKSQHKELAHGHLSRTKMNKLLDDMVTSKKECINRQYPDNITETILLSFLYYKAKTRSDVLHFMRRLHELQPMLESADNDFERSEYGEQDFERGKNLLSDFVYFGSTQAATAIFDNLELVVMTLLALDRRLNRVLMSRYGYQQKVSGPNCVEACFHNLCNILLYNSEKGTFDFTLLPKTLNPNTALVDFFAMQQFKPDQVNSDEVGQAFYNILCAQAGFKYRFLTYNLVSDIAQFLPIMQHLFGSNATTLEELSSQFSTPERQVQFRALKNTITITVTNNIIASKPDEITFSFAETHVDFHSSRFRETMELGNEVSMAKLSNLGMMNLNLSPLLFALVDCSSIIEPEPGRISNIPQPFDKLIALITYHAPQTIPQALNLIKMMLPHCENSEKFQNYIVNLYTNFPELLITATMVNAKDIVLLLLKLGANPNHVTKNGVTALHFARDKEIVAALLEKHANPNYQDNRGCTLLHNTKSADIASMLIAAGANPHLTRDDGGTPLHQAEDEKIAKLLLQAGANANATDTAGNRPLHTTRNSDIAALLLQNGADPHATNSDGCTALHFATNAELALVLLRAGVDPHQTDKRGLSALTLSCSVSYAVEEAMKRLNVTSSNNTFRL